MSKINLTSQPCPQCNSEMLVMWGWQWDYDRQICPECDHEIEHMQTTLEGDEDEIIIIDLDEEDDIPL